MRNALLFLLSLLIATITVAQDNTNQVTVPEVIGLSVPQAAAALNEAGLRLGRVQNAEWTESFGVPPNMIGIQSANAGETLPYGTEVNVTLLREPNVTLIYDDNDLTLVNNAGARIDMSQLEFSTLVSTNNARFRARRWSNVLLSDRCAQIWSLSRNGPKAVPECSTIQHWLTTNNSSDHFWTANNGVQTFSVTYDDQEFAICDAAPRNSQDNPVRCTFFLPVGSGVEVAPFVQLAYTPDILLYMNPTEDAWMRGNRSVIYNPNPNRGQFGESFALGDPDLYGRPDILGDVRRLAPGQCIVFVSDAAPETPLPQSCTSIVTMQVPANQLFWTFDFDIQSRDDKRHKCTAAQIGKLTLCLMPR